MLPEQPQDHITITCLSVAYRRRQAVFDLAAAIEKKESYVVEVSTVDLHASDQEREI